MKIDVDVISDACKDCPALKIEQIDLYAKPFNGEKIVYHSYRCESVHKCRMAINMSKQGEKQNE